MTKNNRLKMDNFHKQLETSNIMLVSKTSLSQPNSKPRQMWSRG